MTGKNEGHALGWARVIALALIHGFQHIIITSLAPVLPLIRAEFALTYSQLGLLASLPNLSGGLLQLPAGILADRAGKIRVLIYGFGLLLSAVFFSALAPTFAILLLLQLLRGVGDSAFHPTTYSLISQGAAPERLGRSMSIHTVGGFAGSAAGVLLVAWLADTFGWRTTFATLAVPGFVLLVIIRLWFREPPAAAAAAETAPQPVRRGSMFTGPLPLIFFAALTGGVAGTGLTSFLPTFLGTEYGMTVTTAGAYSSVMLTAGVLSMLLGGVLADRMDRLNLVMAGGVATCLAVLMFSVWTPPMAVLGLAMVATGAAIYVSAPAYTALISAYSGGRGQGRIYGLSFAGSALGGSVGALLVGYLADLLGFRMAFVAIALAALARAAFIGALKVYDIRQARRAGAPAD